MIRKAIHWKYGSYLPILGDEKLKGKTGKKVHKFHFYLKFDLPFHFYAFCPLKNFEFLNNFDHIYTSF